MKKVIIGVVALLIIIGGIVVFKLQSGSKADTADVVPTPTIALPTVSGDVKVELTAHTDKKAVDLKISGIPADTESVEYEMLYTTGTGLSKGVNGGPIRLNGKYELERSDITIGSCSTGGKCTYDTGVSQINLVLKFNSTNGSSSVFNKSYPF